MLDRLRRAYSEFLLVPTLVSVGLLVVCAGAIWGDRADPAWLTPVKDFLRSSIFGNGLDAADLLGSMASGLVGLTTITFSMLLLALQQTAASIGAQVVNAFLLRRRNQFLLGLILGMTLGAVVLRASATEDTVVAPFVALLFMLSALYALAVLLYSAVNQARPQAVMQEVRTLTLKARRAQAELLRRTRREPSYRGGVERVVRSEDHGYLKNVDLDALLAGLEAREGEAEIELRLEVGEYVAYREELARVRAAKGHDADRLAAITRGALTLDRQRATSVDPAFGIEQIQTSGWSAGSTANQNPGVALEALRNLRDILSVWAAEKADVPSDPAPIVYPDGLMETTINAVESIGTVSTESLQAATMEEVFRTYRKTLPDLRPELQRYVLESVERLLTGLGDLILTHRLDKEIRRLVEVVNEEMGGQTAERIETARSMLKSLNGTLQARSTRVKQARAGEG